MPCYYSDDYKDEVSALDRILLCSISLTKNRFPVFPYLLEGCQNLNCDDLETDVIRHCHTKDDAILLRSKLMSFREKVLADRRKIISELERLEAITPDFPECRVMAIEDFPHIDINGKPFNLSQGGVEIVYNDTVKHQWRFITNEDGENELTDEKVTNENIYHLFYDCNTDAYAVWRIVHDTNLQLRKVDWNGYISELCRSILYIDECIQRKYNSLPTTNYTALARLLAPIIDGKIFKEEITDKAMLMILTGEEEISGLTILSGKKRLLARVIHSLETMYLSKEWKDNIIELLDIKGCYNSRKMDELPDDKQELVDDVENAIEKVKMMDSLSQ